MFVLIGELIALAFSIAAAAVLKYYDSDDMKLCKGGIGPIQFDYCGFFRAANAAFSFSVITSVFCFVCAASAAACIVKEKLYKKLRLIVNVLNILGFIMQLISIIIVPVMFDDTYHKSYFDEPTKEMKAYWACAFLSMIFNCSAAGGCLKM